MKSAKSQNIFLLIFCVIAFILFRIITPHLAEKQIQSDIVQYYSFVTAVFECKDLTYQNNCPTEHASVPIKDGKFVNKRSVGMAYMYTPPYLVSQVIAKIEGRYDNGYSKKTENILVIGIMIYVCIGLFFLGKAMFRYFSFPVVGFCLLALILCTNLTWYVAGEALYTHSVNFMWMSILIYATMKFHDTLPTGRQAKKVIPLLVAAFSLS